MIIIEFQGHKNILGTHYNTFEFTKEDYLTKKGDCIIGVNSKFTFTDKFYKILKSKKQIRVKGIIKVKKENKEYIDSFTGIINPYFNPNTNEIVIRKSDFNSERTLIIKSNKAAKDISREIIFALKDPKTKGECIIKEFKE